MALIASACSQSESSETPAPADKEALAPAPTPTASASDYAPALQVADIPMERVDFEPGSNTTIVEDSITGYSTIDYVVKVDTGQTLSVSMETPNSAAYFNVIAPGETDVAFHIGSLAGNTYAGVADSSGDYRIRVYMMRSAARREETAPYTIEISIGSD